MSAHVWVFERRQRVKIRAHTYDLALEAAGQDDAPWDIGEIEVIDQQMETNE